MDCVDGAATHGLVLEYDSFPACNISLSFFAQESSAVAGRILCERSPSYLVRQEAGDMMEAKAIFEKGAEFWAAL